MSAAAAEQITVATSGGRRRWVTPVIVGSDVFALELSLFFGCLTRLSFQPLFPIALHPPQYAGLAVGVLTLPLACYLIGLYPGYGTGPVQRLRARVYATLFVFGALLTWNYIFEERQWSRGVLVGTMAFALAIPPLLQALLRRVLIARGVFGEQVIILGAGKTGALVARKLQSDPDLGLRPVGMLDDDARKWGTTVERIEVLGPLSSAWKWNDRATMALIAIPGLPRERLADLVQRLAFPNIIVILDLFGLQSLWTMSRDLGGVLGLEVKKNLLVPYNRVLKRVLDCVLAIPLFVVALPVIALSALCIRIASPGPIFFRQNREGKSGQPMTVYKLRTMYPDADRLLADYLDAHPEEKSDWQSHYKLKRDPRVVRGIAWLVRRYSLDELPQLWNVIRGDMSLVGPRPFPYYHLDSFSHAFRELRTSVMPGLTGLWQVSERSDGDLSAQEIQDTYYIRNWSIWLDIFILLRTAQKLLFPTGAY